MLKSRTFWAKKSKRFFYFLIWVSVCREFFTDSEYVLIFNWMSCFGWKKLILVIFSLFSKKPFLTPEQPFRHEKSKYMLCSCMLNMEITWTWNMTISCLWDLHEHETWQSHVYEHEHENKKFRVFFIENLNKSTFYKWKKFLGNFRQSNFLFFCNLFVKASHRCSF